MKLMIFEREWRGFNKEECALLFSNNSLLILKMQKCLFKLIDIIMVY